MTSLMGMDSPERNLVCTGKDRCLGSHEEKGKPAVVPRQ